LTRVGRDIIEAIVLAAVVFLLLQTTVRNFKVDGSSMDPSLEHGQYLLVNRLLYLQIDLERLSNIVPFWQANEHSSRFAVRGPKRGEIIVFEFPDENLENPRKDFVKRVVGLPGETIQVRGGTVIVNGNELEEPYLSSDFRFNAAPVQLEEGEYYVLGDNRARSNDSRNWGPVPEANLQGKVWMVYWPVPGIQFLNVLDRIPGFG